MAPPDAVGVAAMLGPTMRSGMPLATTGSQQNNFRSTGGNSGSLMQNKVNGPGGGGADGAS